MSKINLAEIGFFILLLTGSFVLYETYKHAKSESEQCLNDPLVYGAKKIEQLNGAELICGCSLMKPNSPRLEFNGNSSRITNLNSQNPLLPDVSALIELSQGGRIIE